LVYLSLVFSSTIYKHHAPKLETFDIDQFDIDFQKDVIELIQNLEINKLPIENLQILLTAIKKKAFPVFLKKRMEGSAFSLFALLKLNYSLLTASDYLATSHYMSKRKEMFADFGLLSVKQKKRIVDSVEHSKSYNIEAYNSLNDFELHFPKEANNQNLNYLRKALSVEVIKGVRANYHKNLFYIEAPTGAGKSNLSMLALAELFRNDVESGRDEIQKVFYIFPFTTLINQTYDSLKETLGLNDDEILKLHSKSGFQPKGSDDAYGSEKENIIDYQFLNFPISLISHIRFFDLLKSNSKSTNYLLHRLANSVVVIDELQTYAPREWDKVIYFIENYARYFNMKFILMSATLPKIEKLCIEQKTDFVYLNKYKREFFTNPNFCNRVNFDFSLLATLSGKNEKDVELQKLWEVVKKKSEQYLSTSQTPRVHTIVEFIFKKTASEFAFIAENGNDFFDQIFVLSGSILESRRNEIIAALKSDAYSHKNVLLITTQVVEAGVDIDMDIGFKDTSILDSDEQLAGRINRNVNKTNCTLYLFNLDDAKVIYGKDSRYRLMQSKLQDRYNEILNDKNFDVLYDAVIEERKEINRQPAFVNLSNYIKSLNQLRFNDIDQNFKLIESNTTTATLFLPIGIPIHTSLGKCANFKREELAFLEKNHKYIAEDEVVLGENVWDLYNVFIQNKHADFILQKLNMIILQGIMSKFSLSVSIYSKEFKFCESQGVLEEKHGYYFVNYHHEVYDHEKGFINSDIQSAIIF